MDPSKNQRSTPLIIFYLSQAEFIASYPDAGLRLSLAENTRAPIFILKKLLHDVDADIVASAKKTLAEKDIYDFDDNI